MQFFLKTTFSLMFITCLDPNGPTAGFLDKCVIEGSERVCNELDFIFMVPCIVTLYILIRSNKMQQYAGIYLLQNHSTCFGCPSHPSSGVHKTVTAASGTGHSI